MSYVFPVNGDHMKCHSMVHNLVSSKDSSFSPHNSAAVSSDA